MEPCQVVAGAEHGNDSREISGQQVKTGFGFDDKESASSCEIVGSKVGGADAKQGKWK
jgi:hypothetical protein